MHLEPDTVHPSGLSDSALPEWSRSARYAALRTIRRDGTPVDTPIWFAVDGQSLVFRTPASSAKVRRLTTTPEVELRPSNWRGRPLEGEPWHATAVVLPRDVAVTVERTLRRRYGWQWNTVPMVPVPGVKSAHRGLALRERWRLARATTLWEESVIVRLTARTDQDRAPSILPRD